MVVFSSLSRLFQSSRAFAARQPMGFAMLVAAGKMSAADLFAQKVLEGREALDLGRTCSFLGFGVVQIGFIQYTIYTRYMPVLFPRGSAFAGKSLAEKAQDGPGLRGVVAMSVAHESTVTPFQIFPAFYICKEVCQGEPGVSFPDRVRSVVSVYSRNFWEDNLQSLKIFIPANLLNFCFMPAHLRTPFATMFGLLWAVLLSLSRGGAPCRSGAEAEEEEEAVACQDESSGSSRATVPKAGARPRRVDGVAAEDDAWAAWGLAVVSTASELLASCSGAA